MGVQIKKLPSGTLWIGCRAVNFCWEANIIDGVFYLLSIKVAKCLRGFGFGSQLYAMIESVAMNRFCERIQQTPSGWTYHREPRKDYLVRRGWVEYNRVEVIKILGATPWVNARSAERIQLLTSDLTKDIVA